MKYVTRAQWGARAYRLPGGATRYASAKRRGVKLHYLGGPYEDRAHTQCAAYVRKIQADHMDRNGWSDIGYSFVVCTHGWVYEGRGLNRRNSANGNAALNEQDYAVLLLVGSSGLTRPTDAQLHGARDAIDHCHTSGPAGTWLGGHRDGYATACPGQPIYDWARKGAPRPGGSVPPIITAPKEDGMPASDADIKKFWNLDGFIPAPDGSTDNPYWAPSSILRDTNVRLRQLQGTVTAQGVTIQQLVKTMADLAAGVTEIDTDALIARIEAAIEGVTIHLDVPDAPAS